MTALTRRVAGISALVVWLTAPAFAAVTFTVNSKGDLPDANTVDPACLASDGTCTLRAAIEQANATGGTDTIKFAKTVKTISPATPLPSVTGTAVIDGRRGNTAKLVTLDGSNVPDADGLVIATSDSIVQNIVVVGFGGGAGVHFTTADRNTVQDSFLGVLGDGQTPKANKQGVRIDSEPGSDANKVLRNVIGGNKNVGVLILFSDGNEVAGNRIGVSTADTAVGNKFGVVVDGTDLRASGNVIGGTSAAKANIIGGNSKEGVFITGTRASQNLVQGNFIGVLPDTTALGNGRGGIRILNGLDNVIGKVQAPTEAIEDCTGGCNTISFNGSHGVFLVGEPAIRNAVHGNRIFANGGRGVYVSDASQSQIHGNSIGDNFSDGVRIDTFESQDGGNQNKVNANKVEGNSGEGIAVFNASSNLIGGNGSQSGPPIIGNRITGNATHGVAVGGPRSDNNFVQANDIASNGFAGVAVLEQAKNTLVGGVLGVSLGDCTGQCNVIKNNGGGGFGAGVGVEESTQGTQISANSLKGNEFSGIASAEEPAPVISIARVKTPGATTRVKGSVQTTPSSGVNIEFFSNKTCDESGFGEGQTFVGSVNVATDGTGKGKFSVLLGATPGTVFVGTNRSITATSTDPNARETSAFSNCRGVTELGSCANRCCAGQDNNCKPPGETCFCDDACIGFGDCCEDFIDSCKGG